MELSEAKPEISEDLKNIVSTTIESIKEGMTGKNCGVIGTIDFEVSVIKSKEAKGGFRFLVADASGDYSNESVSKIKFKVMGSQTNFARQSNMMWLEK
jgi:hypothetical protein